MFTLNVLSNIFENISKEKTARTVKLKGRKIKTKILNENCILVRHMSRCQYVEKQDKDLLLSVTDIRGKEKCSFQESFS